MRKTCFSNPYSKSLDYMAMFVVLVVAMFFAILSAAPLHAADDSASDTATTETIKLSEVGRFRITVPAAPEEPQPAKPFRPVLDSSDLVITSDAVVAPFSQDVEAANKSTRVVALLVPVDSDTSADAIASSGVSGDFGENGKATIKLTVTPSNTAREFDLVWVGVK